MNQILKKFTALVLALSVILSSSSFVMANTVTDQQKLDKLVELNVIQGDQAGVNGTQTMERYRSIVMMLRLQGLEDEMNAYDYVGKTTFTDAADKSPYVQRLMAYLKNHPELGVIGYDDGSFRPTAVITAKEHAKIMLEVLGYTFGTDYTWATVSEKAVAIGLVSDPASIDSDTNFTVSDLANFTYTGLTLNSKGNTEKNLGEVLGFVIKTTTPVVTALTVNSVSASNLKEVDVTFNQAVEKASAENKDNYSFATGSVDSVSLSADGKVARITLVSSMTNQAANKISIKNVKSSVGAMKLVEVKDLAFTPVDNTLPSVVSVTALGTKAVKVVFSEPLKTAAIGSFKLDGKVFYGSPTVSSREVVLKPYDTTALTIGSHTLTIAGVEDFSGLKSLSADFTFSVIEDKVAPTMTEVSATLETLTVVFSEDVDPDSVDIENVYFKSGDTKVKATGKKSLAGNKYEFYFAATGKTLPTYETLIYVENVKDYSGNAIVETTKLIKATIDQTRPEVVEVTVNDAKNGFTIKFSKAIKSLTSYNSFITVTDKDSKIKSVYTSTLDATDSTKIDVVLYATLAEGTNSIKIVGIKDATTLENTMLDYSTDVTIGDTVSPEYASHSIAYDADNGVRRVVISFNEKMDAATLTNTSNYIITFNGVQRTLPTDATLTVIQDSKAIMIDFAEKIGTSTVTFGGAGLTEIKVMGVKDMSANVLKDFVKVIAITATQAVTVVDFDADYAGYKAVVTGQKELKVKFDQGIAKASISDFTVTGYTVSKVTTDNSAVVVLELSANLATTGTTPTIIVEGGLTNTMETVAGGKNVIAADITIDGATEVMDMVAPKVLLAATGTTTLAVTTSGAVHVTEVLFTEDLNDNAAIVALYANDLVVTRDSDNKILKANVDYTTTLNANKDGIIINFISNATTAGTNSKIRVAVKADAKYIQDTFTLEPNYALAQEALFTDLAVVIN